MNKPKFRIGDEVELIDYNGESLECCIPTGQIVTVEDVEHLNDDNTGYNYLVDLEGTDGNRWISERFCKLWKREKSKQ